jgi:peptidyl-prolyl cis-trans isomerase C
LTEGWRPILKNGLKNAAWMALATTFLVTAGCGEKASGQVVAVVNGEEITLDELNSEVNVANANAVPDKKLFMRQLLQQVIDRRLLAQAAKAQGLDKDPVYLTQQRRMNEDLLVRLYAKKASDTIPVPDAAAIDRYIADNPAMFAQRTRYTLDQIRFDIPTDRAILKKLEGDHSMTAVAASLTAAGIKFARGAGALDSGEVPAATMQQILSFKAGEPFIAPLGNQVSVSVITGKAPLLVPSDQTRPIAVQSMRNQNLGKIGNTRLKEARAAAKIEYQPGYEAPTAPAAKPK